MSDDIAGFDRAHVWHPFTQEATAPPFAEAVAGDGAHLVTATGERVLDLVSSWWVTLHGHAHPVIARAIADQAARLEQAIFADFTHAPAARLAARLAGLLPGGLTRCFFSDDGSTAVEVALKLAVQYFANRGEARRRLVGFEGGYHGDTVGAMSVGRSSGYFRAWEGMMFPVGVAPYPATWIGDEEIEAKEEAALAALGRELASGDVAAVIIEPLIQGAGGMRTCRPQFLRRMAGLVREAGALLAFDEVMTGFGRTGALFACIGAGVEPDLVCLSKGLTGGFLPMGLTVCTDALRAEFLGEGIERAFLHGHSYTANPLACAAANASLDLLTAAPCREAVAAIAAIHAERLAALRAAGRGRHHRQCGTIAAIEIGGGNYGGAEGARLKARFRAKGMLVRPLGPVAYFMPPYCIAAADLHRAWDELEAAAGDG